MSQSLPKRFFKKMQPKPETITLKPKQLQLPNISLTIPAGIIRNYLLNPVFLIAFACGFLFMAIGIVGLDIHSNLAKLQVAKRERFAVEAQVLHWKEVLGRFNGYRDGLYQLAVLEYRLGHRQEAYDYLEKTLAIDPGFKDAKYLMEKL